MSDFKLCKNCEHFIAKGERCGSPGARVAKIDLVRGRHEMVASPAEWMRTANGGCKEAGWLYKEKAQLGDNVVPFPRGGRV